MKRFLAVIIAMLMLTLCACGTAGGEAKQTDAGGGGLKNGTQSTQQVQEGETAPADERHDYALALHVTINPEVILYLDSNMTILRAEAGNEDGEAVLAGLTAAGRPYAEMMDSLLTAAYDQGYLKEGAHISLGIEIVDGSAFEVTEISAPITRFEQDKGIETEQSLNLLNEELSQEQETTVLNGQTVYIYRLPSMRNGVEEGIETVYTSKKAGAFTDPMDLAVKSVYQGHNGESRVCYYENGVMTQQITTEEDGTVAEFTYYSNGKQKTVSVVRPNGDYQNEEWYESGSVKRVVSYFNGGFSETELAENGNNLYFAYRNADGSYGEEFYFDNGDRSGYESHEPNGDYEKFTFYENGMDKTVEYTLNGVRYKTEYNPDGSIKYSYSAGNEYFFSGGKLVKAIVDGVTYTDAETLAQYAGAFGITQ